MDVNAILNTDFVKQAGAAGIAFLAVTAILLFVFFKVLPKLNQTWADQMTAERTANAKRADEDRQLFRELHQEHVRVAADRHNEVMAKLDKIDNKLPEKKAGES